MRKTSQTLSRFVKANHISIWNWIQWYKPKMPLWKKRRVSEFITDEALLKVGENCGWLWVAIEPIDTIVLGIRISLKGLCCTERFCIKIGYRILQTSCTVLTGGGTWHPQACKSLRLHHHLHSSFEKSIMESDPVC